MPRKYGHLSNKPPLPRNYIGSSPTASNVLKAATASRDSRQIVVIQIVIVIRATYAGVEKSGVHVIAKQNPTVIDLEIAFTKTGEAVSPTALRMDLAALHPKSRTLSEKAKVRVVFCEAKRADDKRLRAGSKGDAEVLKQLQKYDNFLSQNASDLKDAYKSVCRTLLAVGPTMNANSSRSLIGDIAKDECELEIDTTSRLLVFGFDQDQKDGDIFRSRIAELKKHLPERVIAKGNPQSFDLLKDYAKLRQTTFS
jgi:hypothetical protein